MTYIQCDRCGQQFEAGYPPDTMDVGADEILKLAVTRTRKIAYEVNKTAIVTLTSKDLCVKCYEDLKSFLELYPVGRK